MGRVGGGGWAAAATACIAAAALASCRSNLAIAMEIAGRRNALLAADPRREHFFVRDPDTGRPLEEVEGLFSPDGTFVRDGAQRTWWPGGALRETRIFENDEPRGLWTRYWRNGALRMVHEHDPLQPTPMVFWHPNGIVAAEGEALSGLRVGHWVERWPSGVVRAEGDYAAGLEAGEWVYRDRRGEVTARGLYRGGVRVGDWSGRAGAVPGDDAARTEDDAGTEPRADDRAADPVRSAEGGGPP